MFGREEGHWCAAGMGMAATLFAWAEEQDLWALRPRPHSKTQRPQREMTAKTRSPPSVNCELACTLNHVISLLQLMLIMLQGLYLLQYSEVETRYFFPEDGHFTVLVG